MISYFIRTEHTELPEVYSFYNVKLYSEIPSFAQYKPIELNLIGSGLEGIEMFDSCILIWHGWLIQNGKLHIGLEIQFTNDDESLVFKIGWQQYIVDTLFGL